MKNSIMAGLIAGFVSGIVIFIFNISDFWDIFSVLPLIFPVDMQTMALYSIIQNTIWGIIFGVFYAIFYDYIPAEGIKKGIIYGLVIWIIIFVRSSFIKAIHLYHQLAILEGIAYFFSICITYGLLIGYLYKK